MSRVPALIALTLAVAGCSSAATTTDSNPPSGSKDAGDATPSRSTPPATDAATRDAAPKPSSPPASPIVAPDNTWTWVNIPGSRCLDGSETGIAVNPTTASNDVLIFLEGGGACWDATTCWGPVQTAFYVSTGYGEAEFLTDPQVDLYIMDRTDPANPFAQKNMVFVPYCSGDVYSGQNVTTMSYAGIDHTTYFNGYANLNLFLASIAATFPSASRVWLAGDSAGGFGAALNFARVQEAMPKARVDVLDDSGQPIRPDPARWQAWQEAWNMQLPAACSACKTYVGALLDYYRGLYPNNHVGLLSYTYDIVISPFMNITLAEFNTELYALASHLGATWPTAHYFFVAGASHVTLLAPTPEMQTWITQMVTDSPAWASVAPPE
jgi:Pectinacetylesterase